MKKDNIYIGMRYVPRFMGVFNPDSEYEPLSLVKSEEDSSLIYISIIPVPSGSSLTDTTYWQSYTASADTSGLEAELAALTTKVNANEGAITGLTSTVNDNTDNINQNTRTINLHNTSINTNIRNIAALQAQDTQTESKIQQIQSDISNLQNRGSAPIIFGLQSDAATQIAYKYVNVLPNTFNSTYWLYIKNLYQALPTIFKETPYIERLTFYSNQSGAQIARFDFSPLKHIENAESVLSLQNTEPYDITDCAARLLCAQYSDGSGKTNTLQLPMLKGNSTTNFNVRCVSGNRTSNANAIIGIIASMTQLGFTGLYTIMPALADYKVLGKINQIIGDNSTAVILPTRTIRNGEGGSIFWQITESTSYNFKPGSSFWELQFYKTTSTSTNDYMSLLVPCYLK